MFSRNIDVSEAWSESVLPKVIDIKLHRDNTMAFDALAMHVINRHQQLWYWIRVMNSSLFY